MKQKQSPLWLKIIAIFIWLIAAFLLYSLFRYTKSDYIKIETQGTDLHGDFTLYQNTVYVSIPSNGYYPIAEAEVASFRAIDDDYYNKQIGLDKNHVYCGNQIVPKLNPATTKAIGNNYYSDGETTCFCSPYSERNETLNEWQEFWQTIRWQDFKGTKPQTYFYKMKLLPPSETAYYSIKNIERHIPITTNGEFVYHRGELMEDANPNTLYQINQRVEEDSRKSSWYFADGKHAYYQDKKLSVEDVKQLYSFYVGRLSDERYLYNVPQGMVYLKEFVFDESHAPYTLVSQYGDHVYQTLFKTEDNIFFYNTQKENIEKAGENPFKQNDFKEIAPFVFYNGKQTLFIEASEVWSRRSRGGGRSLLSRSTHIYELTETLTGSWQKIGTIHRNYGSVWQNGADFYYFDELGDGQIIRQTIYKIADQTTVNTLVNNSKNRLSTDDIRELIIHKQLLKVNRKELVEAKTKYRNVFPLWKYILGITVSVTLLHYLEKWQERSTNEE